MKPAIFCLRNLPNSSRYRNRHLVHIATKIVSQKSPILSHYTKPQLRGSMELCCVPVTGAIRFYLRRPSRPRKPGTA